MATRRAWLVGATLAAAGAFSAWWALSGGGAIARSPSEAAMPSSPAATSAVTDVPVRDVPPGGTPAKDGGAFRSLDLGGKPFPAVQDGITFEVVTSKGEPVAGAAISVGWYRPGSDPFQGTDCGFTDRRGMFRSSVRSCGELTNDVIVRLPVLGQTRCERKLLLARTSPDTVTLVAPEVAELAARVVDATGIAVAGARVCARHEAALGEPRRYVLECEELEVDTGLDGCAVLQVPVARCIVGAEVDGQRGPLLHCDFERGRNTLLFQLEAAESRSVGIEVRLPARVTSAVRVECGTYATGPQPAQPRVAHVEGKWRGIDADAESDGRYVVRIGRVNWHLSVSADGCAPWKCWIEPEANHVLVELEREDPATVFVVRGVVRDSGGQLLEGAELQWHTSRWPDGQFAVCSDAEGRFVVRQPADEPGWISARDKDSLAFAGPWRSPGRTIEVELRLQPPLSIEGTFVDVAGKSSGGTVRAVPVSAAALCVKEAWIGDDGSFFLGRVPEGTYELIVVSDHGAWPARRVVRAGERVSLRSGEGLGDLARVEATVVDAATRSPIGGAFLKGHGETDDRGRVWLAVQPGNVDVKITAPGYATRICRLAGLDAVLSVATLEMSREVMRFVRVLDEAGRPVSCLIEVVDESRGAGARWPFSEATDVAGRLELHDLPGGRLRLVAQRLGFFSGGRLFLGTQREFALEAEQGERDEHTLLWR